MPESMGKDNVSATTVISCSYINGNNDAINEISSDRSKAEYKELAECIEHVGFTPEVNLVHCAAFSLPWLGKEKYVGLARRCIIDG